MAIFTNKEEYKQWIESDDWYQTIELKNGLITPGKVPTQLREPLFDAIDFKGKSFLDVGCNSGQYCLTAKKKGAREVVGFDMDSKRINQARILAENEGYDITFHEEDIFDTDTTKKYDIVICLAVLTEIQNTISAIEQLKKMIGSYALIEISLARPLVYASYSKRWLKGYPNMSRRTAVAELRNIRGDKWIIDPSFDVLKAIFGTEFKLTLKEGGVRYDLIEVVRVSK